MSVANSLQTIPMKAGADLSGAQYCFVKVSDENTVVVATAGTEAILGILQNTPVAGKLLKSPSRSLETSSERWYC